MKSPTDLSLLKPASALNRPVMPWLKTGSASGAAVRLHSASSRRALGVAGGRQARPVRFSGKCTPHLLMHLSRMPHHSGWKYPLFPCFPIKEAITLALCWAPIADRVIADSEWLPEGGDSRSVCPGAAVLGRHQMGSLDFSRMEFLVLPAYITYYRLKMAQWYRYNSNIITLCLNSKVCRKPTVWDKEPARILLFVGPAFLEQVLRFQRRGL